MKNKNQLSTYLMEKITEHPTDEQHPITSDTVKEWLCDFEKEFEDK